MRSFSCGGDGTSADQTTCHAYRVILRLDPYAHLCLPVPLCTPRIYQVELLRSLTPVQLSRIAVAVKRQEFQKGDRIITKGDEGETMYFLKQGTVRITGVGSGRETVEFALGAGSYFGERALLLGAKRAANVIVTSPTALCLTLDRHVLDQVIGSLREVLDHNMGVSALKTIPYFVSTLRERDINKVCMRSSMGGQ